MVRKVRASETLGGVTLEQYAKVKARLDVEATRAAPRSLAEILDEVGLDEACWADASARWSERVNDDSAARLRQGWLSKRFPPPIAYGVAYAVAVERELSALASELPAPNKPTAKAETAKEQEPGAIRDTLPRPGDRIGLPAVDDEDLVEEGEDEPAAESDGEDSAPTTKERARPVPQVERTPSLADPPRPFRLPERPPLPWSSSAASPAAASVAGDADVEAASRDTRPRPAPPAAAAQPPAALGRLDPDGPTIVGGSPLAGEALPFKPAAPPPMPRLDPDGDTVTGVSPAPDEPLPFRTPASPSDEPDDPEGTRETIPPAAPPAPTTLDPGQRLDPDGATVLGAELREDPPLPFDRGPKRS